MMMMVVIMMMTWMWFPKLVPIFVSTHRLRNFPRIPHHLAGWICSTTLNDCSIHSKSESHDSNDPAKKISFPQICPKMAQNGPKMNQNGPKWPKYDPK